MRSWYHHWDQRYADIPPWYAQETVQARCELITAGSNDMLLDFVLGSYNWQRWRHVSKLFLSVTCLWIQLAMKLQFLKLFQSMLVHDQILNLRKATKLWKKMQNHANCFRYHLKLCIQKTQDTWLTLKTHWNWLSCTSFKTRAALAADSPARAALLTFHSARMRCHVEKQTECKL